MDCEPNRLLAFTAGAPGIEGSNRWSYRIEPSGTGVEVTESFEASGGAFVKVYATTIGKARTRTNIRGMQATLDRMKAIAEASNDCV